MMSTEVCERGASFTKLRQQSNLEVGSVKVKFLVCNGKACRKAGSEDLLCALEKYCQSLGLDKAKVKAKECLGICGRGPAMLVVKRKASLLGRIDPADCKDIVRAVRDHEKKRLKRYLVK